MFYGIRDPFGLLRAELEATLREQVADTSVSSIVAHDEPKFLTLGRNGDDSEKVVVTHFGVCFRALVSVTFHGGAGHELLDTTLTWLLGDVDRRGSERARFRFDAGDNAVASYSEEIFRQRLLVFRAERSEIPDFE